MTTARRIERHSIERDLGATGAATVAALPERRLMAAVLFDAVSQLARRGSTGAAEAARWIQAGDDEDTPISFATVCEALGLDAAYLARGLLAWQATPLGPAVPLPRLHAHAAARRRRGPLRAVERPAAPAATRL